MRCRCLILSALVVTSGVNPAAADEICVYQDKQGKLVQVNSSAEVPSDLRRSAKCFSAAPSTETKSESPRSRPPKLLGSHLTPRRGPAGEVLAPPSEIKLSGLLREASLSSSLGRISLRWPRATEELFGRTPERAVVEAARIASKALKQGAFPPRVQTLNLDWKIVFIEKDPPAGQVPSYLVSSCHPAWMTPPANVYVVAERVTKGCGGGNSSPKNVADATLAQILVHEIGHAVEFYLMNSLQPFEPVRSEGFATWFESYASGFSSVISVQKVRSEQVALARDAYSRGEFRFSGSASDYARASLYFKLLEKRRGIAGIVDFYELIVREKLPVEIGVQKFLGMNRESLQKELRRLIE